MSWSSGGYLAARIWDAVKDHVDDEAGRKLAEVIVDEFEAMDCDNLEEVDGPIGDLVNRRNHEQEGAPDSPEVGETYTNAYRETWRFDGQRWRYVR